MSGIESIMKSAEKLFSKKSFTAVSMGEIALEAGISKANIYHHFDSKEDLYQKILLRCQNNSFSDVLEAEKHPGTYIDKIKFFMHTRMEDMLSNPQPYTLLLREISDLSGSRGNSYDQNLLSGAIDRVVKLIEQAQSHGEISTNVDPLIIAFQLMAPNFMYILFEQILSERIGHIDPKQTKQFCELLANNLLNGIAQS